MSTYRIALANLKFPATPEKSVQLAAAAIAESASKGARIICFPECFVPGYRAKNKAIPPPNAKFLEGGWAAIAAAAERAKIAVVLGTERLVDGGVVPSQLVVSPDGTIVGFQDKVQLDSSEEGLYAAGTGRRVFRVGSLTFGISICHEGWRYPETVRWAVRQGAQLVFHPHFGEYEEGEYSPTTYGDPANSFHEKAVLCRAAENTCYFATVNYASEGSPTTSAVASPDGSLIAYQSYGQEGVLIVDIDLGAATGLLARRYKEIPAL